MGHPLWVGVGAGPSYDTFQAPSVSSLRSIPAPLHSTPLCSSLKRGPCGCLRQREGLQLPSAHLRVS